MRLRRISCGLGWCDVYREKMGIVCWNLTFEVEFCLPGKPPQDREQANGTRGCCCAHSAFSTTLNRIFR